MNRSKMNKGYSIKINCGNYSLIIHDENKKMLLESAPIILESTIKYRKNNYNLLEKDANKMKKDLKLELNKLKRTNEKS